MTFRLVVWSVFALSAAFGAGNKTQPMNVKLGLWKMTYTMEQNGAAPQQSVRPELLAKMTPNQRARTKARLKARAAQAPRIETKQYCLTEEKLKQAVFTADESKACQRTVLASTSKGQQFREECVEGNVKRTAEGKFEALNTDTVKGSLQVRASSSDAMTMTTKIAVIGQWLTNDCGSAAQ